ncbi:uncharacterized protein BO80DRAFT_247559 [Aspergillus ibericus CBS 121593]|uniref:Uncharacterized protein n=1 Tax=Aspergillus ibericus CBS 121593 TaxID=1448316 RepID=A0A395GK39_9EURO|nr:hypothetical protein BO80DRAFT_247559 [Aspergillus ibericus CBS 121593]RAK95851.1 hypothetical protein BO80DRAFT_247559 [Aspergillus ibericus CBS 121593]
MRHMRPYCDHRRPLYASSVRLSFATLIHSRYTRHSCSFLWTNAMAFMARLDSIIATVQISRSMLSHHQWWAFLDSLVSRQMYPRSFQIATLVTTCNQDKSNHPCTDLLHTRCSSNWGILRYSLHNAMCCGCQNCNSGLDHWYKAETPKW